MLGDRDVRKMIEKTFDKIYNNIDQKSNKDDPDIIHALEASHCLRLSYYERKDPVPIQTVLRKSPFYLMMVSDVHLVI